MKGRDEINTKANNQQVDKTNSVVSTQSQPDGVSGIQDIPQIKSKGQLIEEMWFEDEQKQSDTDGIARPGVALIKPSTPDLSTVPHSTTPLSRPELEPELGPELDEPELTDFVTPSQADTLPPPVDRSTNQEAMNGTLQQSVETSQQTPGSTEVQDTEKGAAGFKANPCSSPAAQFMSTCN